MPPPCGRCVHALLLRQCGRRASGGDRGDRRARTGSTPPMTATTWSQRLDGAFSDLFETEVRAFWVTTGTAANCLALAALVPALRRHHLPPRRAYRGRRGRRARLLHGRRQADPGRRAGREGHAGCGRRGVSTAIRKDVHQVQPTALSITNATEYGLDLLGRGGRRARRDWRSGAGSPSTWTARASPMPSPAPAPSPADLTWRAGVDAMSFGFVKNGGLNAEALILFRHRAGRRDRRPPQARRPSAVQGPDARRADPGDARGRSVADQCPRRQCRRADARQGGGRPADLSGRGQ